jgi:hypothetical protein
MKQITSTTDDKGKLAIDMGGYIGEICIHDYQRMFRILEEDFGIKVKGKTEKRKAGVSVSPRQRVSN